MAAQTRKIRPPKASTWDELFRLTDDGEWVEDDGEPGVAFFGRYFTEDYAGRPMSPPIAFSYGTRQTTDYPDVQRQAMDACCHRYGCANGRRVNGRGEWS